MDVAFIGVGKVLPAVTALCADGTDALILVKPQIIILAETEEDERLYDEDPVFGKGTH